MPGLAREEQQLAPAARRLRQPAVGEGEQVVAADQDGTGERCEGRPWPECTVDAEPGHRSIDR